MQIFPTPHFVSFSQAVVYRATGRDVVWPELLNDGGHQRRVLRHLRRALPPDAGRRSMT